MISSEQNLIQYTLTGSGQVLPIPFVYLLPGDIGAISTRASVDTPLILNTDYTLTGGGTIPATGNLTMIGGVAGDIVTIYRALAETQTTSLTTNGPFPAKTIETTYDRLVMIDQRIQSVLSRTLRLPLSTAAVSELTKVARASKLLGFDSNGAVNLISATAAPSDGNNQLVTATGSTTARTLATRFGEICNVFDFGAKGDGVTDDAVAIQAAITAAANYGTVFFPKPSVFYKITSTLVVGKPVALLGLGSSYTAIKGSGLAVGQYILNVDGTVNPNLEEVSIQNLTFLSDSGCDGIKLNRVSNFAIRNVVVRNLRHGIVLTGNRTFSGMFDRVFTTASVTGSAIQFDTNYAGGGQHTFIGCSFGADVGIYILAVAYVNGISLTSCNFEACGTSAILVNGGVTGFSVTGCRFEKGLGITTINLNPAVAQFVYGFTVTGCYFETDAETYAINLGGAGGPVRGFLISGNYVQDYNTFLRLNGEGQSGLLMANKGVNSLSVINILRAGVAVWSNEGFTTDNGQSLTTPLLAISADRGDANVSLVVGADATRQRFATALTANRTVTLPVTAQRGDCFRIVRTGLGAFTLDVGGLKTIPAGTAAFVDVEYDGTAWRLTGYGTL